MTAERPELEKLRAICLALPDVRPPYVGPNGWLGVRLDRDPDWDEITGIVEDAYRKVAPNTLVAELDGA